MRICKILMLAPIAYWLVRHWSAKVVYRGPSIALLNGLNLTANSGAFSKVYIDVLIPHLGACIACVPLARLLLLGNSQKEVAVEVSVVRDPLGSLSIEQVKWPDDDSFEHGSLRFSGAFGSLYYGVLGVIALVLGTGLTGLGCFLCSGFILGYNQPATVYNGARWKVLLAISMVLILVTSIAFNEVTLITYTLGISLTTSCGQAAGLLAAAHPSAFPKRPFDTL